MRRRDRPGRASEERREHGERDDDRLREGNRPRVADWRRSDGRWEGESEAELTVEMPLPGGIYVARIRSVRRIERDGGPVLAWCFDLGQVRDVAGRLVRRTIATDTPLGAPGTTSLPAWCARAGLVGRPGVAEWRLVGRRVVIELRLEAERDGRGARNAIARVLAALASEGMKPGTRDATWNATARPKTGEGKRR